jgi:hypothetical protein
VPRTPLPPTLYVRSRALAGTPLGKILVRAAAVAALLLVGGIVMRQARAQAYSLPDYQLTPASLAFESLPPWADARVEAALKESAKIDFRVSVFDPAAEERVRAAVALHPLVRRVDEVRIRYPRKVAVRVTLRVPACRVATPAKRPDGRPYLMLLSTDARRLDECWYEAYLAQRPPLPVLTGIDRIGPPVEGLAWDNLKDQVAEGLAASAVADRLWRDLSFGRERWVTRVDVARFPARGDRKSGEVVLFLSDGTQIEWGRTDRDDPADLEDPYEKKLLRLEKALRNPAAGGSAPRRLDVRFLDAEPPLPQ